MSGRLKNSRVYLAGPIDRVADSGAVWRDMITPLLKQRGIQVYDPLNKPISLGLEHDDARSTRRSFKTDGDFDGLKKKMKLVRNVDLRMVDIVDFLIVHLDTTCHMCGTYEELFLANRQKKPILIQCPQGKEGVPDWLFGCLPHEMMFSSWAELIGYLDSVNTGENPDHYKRWFWFNPSVN